MKGLVRLTPLFFAVGRAFAFSVIHLQVRGPSTTRRTGEFPSSISSPKTSLKAVPSDEICTIQILMSDTGGGHRASANALRDAFEVLHPGKIQCDIVDIYTDYGPIWPYNDYVAGYKLMAANPWMWDAFYSFGTTDFGMCLNEFLLENICFDAFRQCLNRPSCDTGRRADMVVSVHPLTQGLPLKILSTLDSGARDGRRTTPFCTVVTDLGSAHPTWFNPGVDKCFVPSDALNQVAQQRGLQPSQIVQYGLPIRKGFWDSDSDSKSANDKPSLRSQLGLEPDLPVVLVVGGGDGMGGLVDIAKQLGKELESSGTTATMVVVCGNNKDAKQQLDSVAWGEGVKVSVQGFVNNMDEWMKASDALVTKAGPGSIAEASICGLPCMMFSFLPGQEEGNIPFVEEAGFGTYSANPETIGQTVSSWLSNPDKLEVMKKAALEASRPHATLDIAKDIADMLFEHKQKKQSIETPSFAVIG